MDTDSSEIVNNDWNPSMLQTIHMPNNVHYLTDRLPKANYKQTGEMSSSKTKHNSKIQAERTMPLMGEAEEVLDTNERTSFLAEIKQVQRVRVQSGVNAEIYSARVASAKRGLQQNSPIREPQNGLAGQSSIDELLLKAKNSRTNSNRVKKKPQYNNRYQSNDPKNIELQIQKYNELLLS